MRRQPAWYQGAVFYELLVRSFQDSDGDGIGDLTGLLARLDYLQWLGVDCLWLLPLFPSPLRDGGYDVSDFRGVHEHLGTLEDLTAVVDAAHARGLRVVMDMLLNHTSDQHPWFQASRQDPTGPYGDFYVWADDDSGHPDVPVVFCDTEPSNWTYDEVRGQYYWHRFFRHQPDLNYDNPRVRDEMLAVMRFWLERGVDGFRLDAVPYLYEQEGTSCAHLPQTHAFLKDVRAVVEREFPGRVLLAEANGSSEEVAEYFGDGDECQLAMHFPLMPQVFLALATGAAGPVADVIAQTPEPPAGCSWSTFVRNHDELSLESVTEDERALLYAAYCPEERMRANVGIRRRLAPLLGHSDAAQLLVTSLLLSLPGTPILYYGDEIGMGDNIWLEDRDAVRTPMQWTPTGGFSASPSTYYPVNDSALHGPGAVNVEGQLADESSLLRRTQEALSARRQHPALQRGAYVELSTDNPAVLAFVRVLGDDAVLCLHSFSSFPQPVAVELGEWGVHGPVSLQGQAFPVGEDARLTITMEGHGALWLSLAAPDPLASLPHQEEPVARQAAHRVP
ncbi:MAG TPA: maltose alpha-D-glucosyltransferase [Mycobacteriales bacterium]|nr:maltose alpha-D-glucosyltransferase [Mycobacteriales bacterium]